MAVVTTTLLCCVVATFHLTIAQVDLSLCSQVYQMHQYCTRGDHQGYVRAEPNVIHGRKGKAGPPGKSEKVDYAIINATIAEYMKDLGNKLEMYRGDDIQQLQNEVQALQQQNGLWRTGWRQASNGVFYQLFPERVNYATAKAKCEEQNAILASKVIRDSFSEIQALVESAEYDAWIGLNDIAKEGTWVWEDGNIYTAVNTPWIKGQPDDSRGHENCVHVSPYRNLWQLNDRSCAMLYQYVCEKTA